MRRTAAVAVLALVLSVLAGLWNHNFGSLDWGLRVALTAVLGALAVLTARLRESAASATCGT